MTPTSTYGRSNPPKYPVGPTAPSWNSYPDEPGTADELLAEMDEHGVDRAVLVQTSWSTWDNGYIADSAARFPDRFVGARPDRPAGRRQRRAGALLGQGARPRGLPFPPDVLSQKKKILLTEQNGPLWEEIAALEAVIQFHLRAEEADQIAVIATRYPHLTLILDHLGYPQVDLDKEAYRPIVDLARYDNVHVKLSDVAGHSRTSYPHADVHPFIAQVHSAFGAARMIWGTGYPGHHRVKHDWPPLAQELRLIREGLPFLREDDKERILGGTAARIWGLT